MEDFLGLSDKHILVTGATSGIGRATAQCLSAYGARMTVLGRRAEQLQETLAQLTGTGHTAVCFDLSETGAIEEMIRGVVANGGPLDGFVQSAGTNTDLPLQQVKPEKLHQMMQTNFYSFFELVRVISRKGRFQAGCSMVGVSSTAAECGVASQTAYTASKAAMNGTMRAMARELAPKGIRVNTVLPGPTNTEMYRAYLSLRAGVKQPDAAAISGARNYLGMSEPEDIAHAIAFLLSPASRMITGIELPVDAGYTSC